MEPNKRETWNKLADAHPPRASAGWLLIVHDDIFGTIGYSCVGQRWLDESSGNYLRHCAIADDNHSGDAVWRLIAAPGGAA